MNTAALREQISRAHQHEASTGQLAQQLETQLPHLHSAISLADGDRNIVMTRFVTAYIDLVPDPGFYAYLQVGDGGRLCPGGDRARPTR